MTEAWATVGLPALGVTMVQVTMSTWKQSHSTHGVDSFEGTIKGMATLASVILNLIMALGQFTISIGLGAQ